ncbi:TatD family hydrolase [Candidatus Pandoraea novymonadis]|uniref:Metal-dependent hydrolase YcfH n=1 Tax=Candidatus Pandoraea novymonadis TaxID=1808959 RepID=A0ABX5FEJ6_9BURK|nr:TatD family hydrolase [Candidatus Pandoraea novymonadis]PSB92120.1 putative metal-dependent hydrolase YcfH [Candidatus Pandoraea novymonadis]
MFIDSHCHLNFQELATQMPELLAKMREAQVSHALCVSVDLLTLPDVLAIASSHENIYASVGVHPDHKDMLEPSVNDLIRLSNMPKVVAIGETGLDYYRLESHSIEAMEWQRNRFRRHIQAAKIAKKPLIIHTRSAAQDTLRLMREEKASEVGGVVHCFTESWEFAAAVLAENFYISFSGIITFKNAGELTHVVRRVPLNKMLIETDSPYLAPVPYRGKLNQPSYVKYVAEFIAKLRGESVEAIAEATSDNFHALFSV